MGAGIAVQMRKNFRLHFMEREARENPYQIGSCLFANGVLNLITKKFYFHKPTYENFALSIQDMKKVCLERNISKIAMPTLGSGLDGLNWKKNSDIIKSIFEDTNIEIIVCILKK